MGRLRGVWRAQHKHNFSSIGGIVICKNREQWAGGQQRWTDGAGRTWCRQGTDAWMKQVFRDMLEEEYDWLPERKTWLLRNEARDGRLAEEGDIWDDQKGDSLAVVLDGYQLKGMKWQTFHYGLHGICDSILHLVALSTGDIMETGPAHSSGGSKPDGFENPQPRPKIMA